MVHFIKKLNLSLLFGHPIVGVFIIIITIIIVIIATTVITYYGVSTGCTIALICCALTTFFFTGAGRSRIAFFLLPANCFCRY